MTKKKFKEKAKEIIDNEPFANMCKLFDYESFTEMKVAHIPDEPGLAEAYMPLEDFLDSLYDKIKGDLKRNG